MKFDNFMELVTKEEPLCDELAEWVRTLDNGMMMVNHPLVQDLILNPACCALYNQRLQFKTEEVKKAYAERNHHRYVFLHERPYRFEALQRAEMLGFRREHEYPKLVAAVWMDSENIWQHKEEWIDVFEGLTKPLSLMNAVERGVFRKLPKMVTIHRGVDKDNGDWEGLSWTLDFEKAKWFSKRYGKKAPLVITCTTPKENVVAYFNGRNEKEIVVVDTEYCERTE